MHELPPEAAKLLDAAEKKALESLAPEVRELLDNLPHVGGEDEGENLLIHYAARAGDIDELRRLIAAGAPVNARGFRGCTPLTLAARDRHACPEVVRMLLAAGADPALRDSYGSTALGEAVKSDSDDAEVVKLLLDAGADVNARYGFDCSLLSCVHSRRVLALLVEAGIDLRAAAENKHGFPAWSRIGDPELAAEVQALVEHARAGREGKPLPGAEAGA